MQDNLENLGKNALILHKTMEKWKFLYVFLPNTVIKYGRAGCEEFQERQIEYTINMFVEYHVHLRVVCMSVCVLWGAGGGGDKSEPWKVQESMTCST